MCDADSASAAQAAGPGISIPNRLEKVSVMLHRSPGKFILTRSTIAPGMLPWQVTSKP